MKKIILGFALCLLSIIGISQSIAPSIVKVGNYSNENEYKTLKNEFLRDSTVNEFVVTAYGLKKNRWYLPFWENTNSLINAYDNHGNKWNGPSGISIRPVFDSTKSVSTYVELASIIPWKYCRFGIGTNLVQSDLEDSTRSQQDIAFQKITNGGGNIVLNASRPIIYYDNFLKKSNGFIVACIDLTGYADLPKINEDIYNPAWGAILNLSWDLRLVNAKILNRQEGNIFRFGINGRILYNVFNEAYKQNNKITDLTNKLGIGTIGAYLGVAMFNIQVCYNIYNKTDDYFSKKDWLFRVEVIPVKF